MLRAQLLAARQKFEFMVLAEQKANEVSDWGKVQKTEELKLLDARLKNSLNL